MGLEGAGSTLLRNDCSDQPCFVTSWRPLSTLAEEEIMPSCYLRLAGKRNRYTVPETGLLGGGGRTFISASNQIQTLEWSTGNKCYERADVWINFKMIQFSAIPDASIYKYSFSGTVSCFKVLDHEFAITVPSSNRCVANVPSLFIGGRWAAAIFY